MHANSSRNLRIFSQVINKAVLTYELGVDSKKSFTAILRLRGAFSHDSLDHKKKTL